MDIACSSVRFNASAEPMSGLGAPARTAMPITERATGKQPSASTKPSAMNSRCKPSATITMSTTSPRFKRFASEFSPVPTEVDAVITVFFVRRCSCGINARCAAVNAPEVITLNSLVVVVMMV